MSTDLLYAVRFASPFPAKGATASALVLVERALRNAFGALEIVAAKRAGGARQLEHRPEIAADEDRDHRRAAHAALGRREARRERAPRRSVRRSEDRSP